MPHFSFGKEYDRALTGCLEPDNLTLNTARLGSSLREVLAGAGVQFSLGREVRLVPDGDTIAGVQCRQTGELITGDKEGNNNVHGRREH